MVVAALATGTELGPEPGTEPGTDPGTEPARGGPRPIRLADIRAAGLVRHASEQVGAVERSLPVAPALRPLLPGGFLRRGGTVSVLGARAGTGATSLLLALVATASTAGSWCAAVGLPRLGLVAAAEAGVAVERFALVPSPGSEWAGVVAALLDGVDIVAVATPGPVPAPVANRLVARARQRGSVLVSIGSWPGAEVSLEVVGSTWHGLGQGRGRLRGREVEVVAHGRGAAARAHRVHVWLPEIVGLPADVATLPLRAPARPAVGPVRPAVGPARPAAGESVGEAAA
jgi:hypothetical protein